MPKLSLDCLTLTDTAPVDLIHAAAAAGFDLLSLWTGEPAIYPRQRALPGDCAAIAAALAETGVGVHTIEVFDLTSPAAVESYRPALELGAALGGRSATAIHHGNPDRNQVVGMLRQFAAIAAECGLATCIEPIAMGYTRTLAEAAALIDAAGVDAGITCDFLHVLRTGEGPADVAAIAHGLIRYVQVCDGPLEIVPEQLAAEGVGLRLLPGSGEFPIADLLKVVPPDAIIGLECPDIARLSAGISPVQLAREAMTALRGALTAI